MSDAGERRGAGNSKLPPARIALIAAGVIALSAVGTAVWRDRAEPATVPASVAEAQNQPTVEAMVENLQTRLKKEPADAQGWRMLGWSYYRMERFKDAVAAYKRAVVVDPKSAEGWSALGESIALAQGDATVPAEAVAAFNKALSIDRADPRARYFLAVKKDLDGDHEGAINDWVALLKETPAGAPWEQNVRQTVMQVAEKNKIDVASRLPAPAPPAPGTGEEIATSGIPGPTQEQLAAASSIPPSQQDEMVQGMVSRLASRLRQNPKDADGWIRLMRARMVLNDPKAAAEALANGKGAFAGDAAAQGRLTAAAKTLGVPGA